MGGPYKISNEVAVEIRRLVASSLEFRKKVSPGVVRVIKEYAEGNYFSHLFFNFVDPEYKLEGGPANLVNKSLTEVEELRSSRERLG